MRGRESETDENRKPGWFELDFFVGRCRCVSDTSTLAVAVRLVGGQETQPTWQSTGFAFRLADVAPPVVFWFAGSVYEPLVVYHRTDGLREKCAGGAKFVTALAGGW
jgi:hypothetical protein